MPTLKNLTEKKQAAELAKQNFTNQSQAQKAEITKSRQAAEAIQARTENHVAMQKEAKSKADAMRKEYNTKLTNIKDLNEQRANLEQMNAMLDHHIDQLKKAAANTSITKEQLIKAQQRLSKAKENKASVLSKLKHISLIGTGLGGMYGAYKGAKLASTVSSLPEASPEPILAAAAGE
jgi:myosin heavy subunit